MQMRCFDKAAGEDSPVGVVLWFVVAPKLRPRVRRVTQITGTDIKRPCSQVYAPRAGLGARGWCVKPLEKNCCPALA